MCTRQCTTSRCSGPNRLSTRTSIGVSRHPWRGSGSLRERGGLGLQGRTSLASEGALLARLIYAPANPLFLLGSSSVAKILNFATPCSCDAQRHVAGQHDMHVDLPLERH